MVQHFQLAGHSCQSTRKSHGDQRAKGAPGRDFNGYCGRAGLVLASCARDEGVAGSDAGVDPRAWRRYSGWLSRVFLARGGRVGFRILVGRPFEEHDTDIRLVSSACSFNSSLLNIGSHDRLASLVILVMKLRLNARRPRPRTTLPSLSRLPVPLCPRRLPRRLPLAPQTRWIPGYRHFPRRFRGRFGRWASGCFDVYEAT
jgi:hypothetical protein